ncbi:MAG: PQQ-dependent sugar dehydrogenase [Planctomycetes bacterium]|nr:PQQ-dependent sugar dehydrogenase [Planctomycetota bacterium]
MDTSRLMGSPDPLPLEAARVYPRLKFQRPVAIEFPGDGSRAFVVEQRGTIRVFENSDTAADAAVFLDLRDVVLREGNEEGLLGLAFHPKFDENREFFVYYSTPPRTSVVSRFNVDAANPDRALRDSEEVLLKIEQPYPNHNGGSIEFGPDAFLYVGLGDGGAAGDPHGHGQNLGTLLGSILRIDVDRRDKGRNYAIPPDNPFVGRKDARGEIWAYGLRNVWRLAFDRETGDLWAGDVGQDRYEEVDRIVRGGNYGWNLREGRHPYLIEATPTDEDLIEPVAEYFHNEGQSVTGGRVYRGRELAEFRGDYFYADYVTGVVWAVSTGRDDPPRNRRVAETGLEIAAFGEGRDGELYLTAFDGNIYRLRRREADLEAIRAAFPRTLTETGLFASVRELEPVAGCIPYDVNVPFWSDFAVKQRFLALPRAKSITFYDREKWEFPVGTVFIKTFFLPRVRDYEVTPADPDFATLRRLETRLFLRAPHGWVGYTYLWNEEQTEARLLDGSLTREYEVETPEGVVRQPWYFPSRADCMACHTPAAKFVLGWNARQMNRTHECGGGTVNQIETLARLGAFANRPAIADGELEAYPDWQVELPRWRQSRKDGALTNRLARAWLDVNCGVCHTKDGIAKQPLLDDHRPLGELLLVDQKPREPHLGPGGTKLLVPGEPQRSELLHRIRVRGERQMPPLATNVAHPAAVELIRTWIEQLPGAGE